MTDSSVKSIMSIFDLSGRVALVTGASSGIGRHLSVTLAAAGAEVMVTARRIDLLHTLVAEIEANGGKAHAIALDVTRRHSIQACLDATVETCGRLDIVVNNAGVSNTKNVLKYDDDDWDAIIDTNLKGAWILAQEAAQRMVGFNRGGSIINVTSILAERVSGGVGPYCAAKAGLSHLTRSMALELARYAIRVNAIAPGYIVTELNEEFLRSPAGDQLKSRIPSRSFGECSSLDGALLLLASDAGRYMTGSEIVVDGGHLCSSL
ncbi:glucose 1-dehydrogenase [Glaciimonas sp. CA11.2]|uniref:SDR family NAD(P)-dependent oxidoreductase n=1 Tax=unclassified Glaciimonas TaxID=2644401 RepID=UPI002AB38FD5|nr:MULTISPECIES: glucose 1-dehydrogenase [unclassified Glaciimonas]MDY7547008.1 glucose 1-dehydrogenase [Glaciimonas sp. CA11.2]MEB0011144.1 glucose 1-dehydrogenase [Glaciimonas sp. Cout2]MEB0081178.1 glucose 1-dehydrogenase [Glaciimonas sp. Gout2]MEB0162752.1 glucose 1-dehydrogenase [Glaciimonas sp. CA11.2]